MRRDDEPTAQSTAGLHTFQITATPCDWSFSGLGSVTNPIGGNDGEESITGFLDGKGGVVSWHATNGDGTGMYEGYEWWYPDAYLAGLYAHDDYALFGGGTDRDLPFTMTLGPLTASSDFAKHGAYVKFMGGGDDAAHSCIGRPVVSSP